MSAAGPATVTVRFWAGARRAAGHAQEQLSGDRLGAVLDQLSARPALARVMATASFLVDGQQAGPADALPDGAVVDVLPPFAGG